MPSPQARIKLTRKQTQVWRMVMEDRSVRVLLQLGARGSGKSKPTPAYWIGETNTGQRHLFASNSHDQLVEGILQEHLPMLDASGVAYTFGHRAPASWRARWDREGTPYPSGGPRNPNTLILETGRHTVVAGFGNGKFRRVKGYEFGSCDWEEVTEHDKGADVVRFILPSIRCGLGDEGCVRMKHNHVLRMYGNPPLPSDVGNWIHGYVEENLQREQERREDGRPEFFRLVKSSAYDNVVNLGENRIREWLEALDEESARAIVHGELVRSRTSLAYHAFSEKNIAEVPYIPNRPVYLGLDFNVDPAVAILWHLLTPDEVPAGISPQAQIMGVFGELWRDGGTGWNELVDILCSDRPARGLRVPPNFRGLENHLDRVICFRDTTSKARSMAAINGQSLWTQIHNEFARRLQAKWSPALQNANPPVHDRVGSVNAKLSNAVHQIGILIAPRVIDLPRDLNFVTWTDNGLELNKTADQKRTHSSDALGYGAHGLFPVIFGKGSRTRPETYHDTDAARLPELPGGF